MTTLDFNRRLNINPALMNYILHNGIFSECVLVFLLFKYPLSVLLQLKQIACIFYLKTKPSE